MGDAGVCGAGVGGVGVGGAGMSGGGVDGAGVGGAGLSGAGHAEAESIDNGLDGSAGIAPEAGKSVEVVTWIEAIWLIKGIGMFMVVSSEAATMIVSPALTLRLPRLMQRLPPKAVLPLQ